MPITKQHTSQALISTILDSHGFSPSCSESDGAFWAQIQRTITEKQRTASKLKRLQRDPKNKPDPFLDDCDPTYKRLELLRELYFHPKTKAHDACIQYGITHASYYRLTEEYRIFGLWAILSAPSYWKDFVSAELQLKIILHKRKYPLCSPQQIVDEHKLKFSRFSVNRVLKRWKLINKNLTAVALDQYINDDSEHKTVISTGIIPAILLLPENQLLKSRKMNRHFNLISKKMEKHQSIFVIQAL